MIKSLLQLLQPSRLRFIQTFLLIMTVVLLVLILNFKFFGLTGTLTESEPPGIYRITQQPVMRGRMVELRQLLKHVAGVPGDTVRVTLEGCYVNGKLWPHSAIPTRTAYAHYPFGVLTLQAGQYWLLGEHPLSWDSRYLGPIPLEMINATVEPFWTTSNGYATGSAPLTRETQHQQEEVSK